MQIQVDKTLKIIFLVKKLKQITEYNKSYRQTEKYFKEGKQVNEKKKYGIGEM